MSFGRDIDIGKGVASDVTTVARLEALLALILERELDAFSPSDLDDKGDE